MNISPNQSNILEQIQHLQFSDRASAESLVMTFIQTTFPQLEVTQVELHPLAVSLNSFNGFLTLTHGKRLFFKTHVEQDTIISEYYNAGMLAEVGYPVIQPLYSSTQSGQQLLMYEVVTEPSVFDIARRLETSQPSPAVLDALTAAQHQADDHLFQLYLKSLAPQSTEQAAKAPIHQLFYHRLTGGRLDRFYGVDTQIALPHGTFSMSDVRRVQWVINDRIYSLTLDEIIAQAAAVLNPAHPLELSVIGHGDAHNGNVFFNEARRQLTYFDPAFAGRHHPLLDLTKPLFHNVFAMWMYFPEQEREKLGIHIEPDGSTWHVMHNYTLSPVREMFLQSKVQRVLLPIMKHLQHTGKLIADWRRLLKSALFCCPFLTLDLKRFPPEIALLGLTMAVEMGAESVSDKRSRIDMILDQAAAAIQTAS
jgi:hypothetical protein